MFFSIGTTVAIMVCYSVVFMTGVIGNFSILVTILTSSRFRKSLSNILISDLALADFFLCMITAPYYISSLLADNPPQPGASSLDSICKGFVVSAYALGFTRILLLATISVERFIAIIHPFWYQKYSFSSPGGIQLACICFYAWFHSYLCTFPAAFIDNWIKYEGKPARLCAYAWESANLGFVLPVFTLNFFIPLCVIVYTNCKVYATARRQGKRIATSCRITSPTEFRPTTREPSKRKYGRQEFLSPLPVTNTNDNLFLVKGKSQAILRSSTIGSQNRKGSSSPHSDIDSAYSEQEELRFENQVSLKMPFLDAEQLQKDAAPNTAFRKISFQRVNESAEDNEISNSVISNPTTFQRTTKTSVYSKLDDSGFKDLRKFSCYSEVNSQVSEKKSVQIKVSEMNDFKPKSSKIRRFPLLQPRQASPYKRNSKFHGRTKDYVIFFSTLSVVTLFLLTWLPFAITTISVLITGTVLPEKADIFISMMTVIDSAFTPVIVFGTRREFRKALVKRLFKRSLSHS
ncbi:muscarinic acetylcholine receptor M5-like [Rhopilema esculentum]|uniref:muscarinic acetylcholine receptor M5-like n=1 Tax=Rhopilema esculentum TaxID=499914 RepID=UPI0031E01FAF